MSSPQSGAARWPGRASESGNSPISRCTLAAKREASMGSLLQFIAGMVVALLPRQYRMRWAWASDARLRVPTIFSGLVESVISLGLVIFRYFGFLEWRVGTIADAAVRQRGGEEALDSLAVQSGMGFTTLAEYLFSPLTLLLLYFAVEGGVRFFAALSLDQCAGTLPLYAIARGWDRLGIAWNERQLGPRVPDLVQYCKGISYDLCIATCRRKPGWNQLITIEYEDEFYELFAENEGCPPRPHIYQLRKLTPGRVIRGLHHYHPDEALTEKQRMALLKDAQKRT
jgi:hypothetical protein